MNGFKRVRTRRDDALAQVDWKQLEALLAVYYRGQGYEVEHVGTGCTGARFDGGIDLKLRRDDAYVLVQAKHWNAYQVPHNAVHELLGIMVNEGATGAILVTSGEFTRAAIAAATRQGRVQLVDGAGLRAMLGPLPGARRTTPMPGEARAPGDRQDGSTPAADRPGSHTGAAAAFARAAGDRLLDAAEDRIRQGRGRRPRARSMSTTGLGLLLPKLAMAAVLFALVWSALQLVSGMLQAPRARSVSGPPAPAVVPPRPTPARTGLASPAAQPTTGVVRDAQAIRPRAPTAAEIRAAQRRADEAIRVIEASTPEM